ncbi:MAG: hypothetical protein H9533_21905 [Rhodobacteraceae bacterium]|nr:hypothetical protein [Paracoccaceae bacterium]
MDLDDVDDDSPLLPSSKVGLDEELDTSEGNGGQQSGPIKSYQKVDDSKKSIFDLSEVEDDSVELSKAAQQRLRASAQQEGFRNSRPVQYGRPPTGRNAPLHVRIRPELLHLLKQYQVETGTASNVAIERAICALLKLDFVTLRKISDQDGQVVQG